MFWGNVVGNFCELFIGILMDLVMFVYFDNGENCKGYPNENFGCELFELFMMGVGNYIEWDICEVFRVFIGWMNDVFEFRFDVVMYDDGDKMFFGWIGFFDGEDIIDIVFDMFVVVEFIVLKFYWFFVWEEIDDLMRVRLGVMFCDVDYELCLLLCQIFFF